MSDIIRAMALSNLERKYPDRKPSKSEQAFFDRDGVQAYAADDGRPVVSSRVTDPNVRASLLANERYRLMMQGHGMQQAPYLGSIPMTQEQRDQFAPYGYRIDGTPKGRGYLGPIPLEDGSVATEVSFDFDVDGKNILAPLLVPGHGVARDPYDWAAQHAIKRVSEGKSPFADTPEYAKPNSAHGEQSMVARILAGDPSAKTPTDAQRRAAQQLETQAALMK